MAQIRETRYVCDSCGQQVEKKGDLRKFVVVQHDRAGRWDEDTSTDLCSVCENEFLKLVRPFFADASMATIDAMARAAPTS